MNRPTVIIVEKSEEFCQRLNATGLLQDCELIEVHDGSSVVQSCEQKKPRIIVCAHDSTGDAIQLGRQIRAHHGQAILILVTQYSTEEHAIAALKAGFNDYFKVPNEYPELLETLGRELAAAQSEPQPKKDRNRITGDLPIIGGSPEIQRIKEPLNK
jgi:DNA-binding NtrC family response regulator